MDMFSLREESQLEGDDQAENDGQGATAWKLSEPLGLTVPVLEMCGGLECRYYNSEEGHS